MEKRTLHKIRLGTCPLFMHTIFTNFCPNNIIHTYKTKSYPQNVDKMLITFLLRVKIYFTHMYLAFKTIDFSVC